LAVVCVAGFALSTPGSVFCIAISAGFILIELSPKKWQYTRLPSFCWPVSGLSPVWPGTVWWRWLAVERSQPSNMITRRGRPAVCPQSGQKVPLPKLSLRVVELSAGCARGNPSTDRETQQCSDSCELDSCHIQSPKSLPFPTEASGYHEYTAFYNSLVPEPRVATPPLLPR
jgi:hypothetical protein